MKFVLFIIMLNPNGVHHKVANFTFSSMDECFMAREVVVQEIGRPIINYQAICVPEDNTVYIPT